MTLEKQPLMFKEKKEGTNDCYVSYMELTPETLLYLQNSVGKRIDVVSVNEKWHYEGDDEPEDHSISEMKITGILSDVTLRTISVDVQTGKVTFDSGSSRDIEENRIELRFYQEQYGYRTSTEKSQITSFTIDDVSFIQKNGGLVPDQNPEEVNLKATKAIQDIKDLISSYATTHTRPDINGINRILTGLSLNDYKVLQNELEELYTTQFAGVFFDPLAEIFQAAESDRQFGNSNGGMDEFYENEGRAAAKTKSHEKILESIDNLVAISISKTLETLITESAGHTKSCVAYYDNGDFIQSAHQMNVTIPDGVNPWVFARVYILTKTTPGENGLYVDGIKYTGSDGQEKWL
jgi:hypothetical protein